MYVAAKTLSEQVTQNELDVGCLYPPLSKIRNVSAHIAVAIAKNAYKTGVATNEEFLPTTSINEDEMMEYVKSLMYDPFEDPYVAAAAEVVLK